MEKGVTERVRRDLVRERLGPLGHGQQPGNTFPPVRDGRIKPAFAGPEPVVAAVLRPLKLQFPKLRLHKIRYRNTHPVFRLLLKDALIPVRVEVLPRFDKLGDHVQVLQLAQVPKAAVPGVVKQAPLEENLERT